MRRLVTRSRTWAVLSSDKAAPGRKPPSSARRAGHSKGSKRLAGRWAMRDSWLATMYLALYCRRSRTALLRRLPVRGGMSARECGTVVTSAGASPVGKTGSAAAELVAGEAADGGMAWEADFQWENGNEGSLYLIRHPDLEEGADGDVRFAGRTSSEMEGEGCCSIPRQGERLDTVTEPVVPTIQWI